MSSFEEKLVSLIDDSEQGRTNRLELLRRQGHDDVHAILIDDAFKAATEEAVRAIGKEVDGLPADGSQINGLMYILRAFNANMAVLEDVLNMLALNVAVDMGVPVAMPLRADGSSDPLCNCPTCSAVREANRRARGDRSVH